MALTLPKQSLGGNKTTTRPSTELPEKIEVFGKTLVGDQISKMFFQRAEVLKRRDPRYGRFILIGKKGSGKTYSCIKTLPRPILHLCIDPNAEGIVNPDEIERGEVLPILYYGDNPKEPTLYLRYEEDMISWAQNGFFDAFASVVVDGLTSLMAIQLNQIAYEDKKRKDKLHAGNSQVKTRTGLMPELQDYNVLKSTSILGFMALCSIPCHLVLTAHIAEERYFDDNDAMRIREILNATPALTTNIPPLFSEVYLSTVRRDDKLDKDDPNRKKYVWVTDKLNAYKDLPLCTRFNVNKKLVEDEIPQDFRALLKRVGFLWEDKPFITRGE